MNKKEANVTAKKIIIIIINLLTNWKCYDNMSTTKER